MVGDIISARLDLIAAKAKILSEQYKSDRGKGNSLEIGLQDIEREIASVRHGIHGDTTWYETRGGTWFPDDK